MSGQSLKTIERIEKVIPVDHPVTSLDIWRASGGVSESCVSNVLVHLYQAGKVQRITQTTKTGLRYLYVRVQ